MSVTAGLKAARSIENWHGSDDTFVEAVVKPIENAIDEALTIRWPTPLYLCWTALYRRQSVVDRKHAFFILDMITQRKRPQLKEVRAWKEYAESVLNGTLCAMHPGLESYFGRVPERSGWVGAALAAFRAAGRPQTNQEDAAFECLTALLDVIARVHGRNPDEPESALSPWRLRLFEEAEALASCAQCKDERPISLFEVIEGAASETEQFRAAELLISVCADALDIQGEDRRLSRLSDIAASRPVRSPTEASEVTDGRTRKQRARDIERLLHHFACETPLFSRLLEIKLDYKLFEPSRQPRQIESVNSLEQKILLMGPPSVGKSWFLFASSELCQFPTGEAQPKDGKYPKMKIRTSDGRFPDQLHEMWQDSRGVSGETGSLTKDFNLLAKTEPWGLSAYRILDAPGEITGLQARQRGSSEGHLRSHVRRINPTVMVLMLSDDDVDRPMGERRSKDRADVEDVCQGLRTVLTTLGDSAATIPIYLVVNKTDVTLKGKLREKGVSKERVKLLSEGLRASSFDIGRYFDSSDGNGLTDFKNAMRNMISDPELTRDPAVREFIAITCERWRRVIGAACERRSSSKLFLAFTSSLCGASSEDDAFFPGVNGFWNHLWTNTAVAHEPALEAFAAQIFDIELRKNVEGIISRWDEAQHEKWGGLKIPDWPMLHDNKDFARVLKFLCEETNAVARKVESLKGLAGDALDTLHGQSSDCYRQVIGRLEQFEREAEGQFRRNVESIVRGLIDELNVDPDRRCVDFSELELTREDRKWLRDYRERLTGGAREEAAGRSDSLTAIPHWIQRNTLDLTDIHDYFGCLRDSSVARHYSARPVEHADETVNASTPVGDEGSQELLRRGGRDTVCKLICSVVHDTATRETDLRNLLWFIADYGRELDRAEGDGRWPDYEILSPRLLDQDFFLLQAQKRQNEGRLDRLASLIELFVVLRRIVTGGSTEFGRAINGSGSSGFRQLVDVPVLCEVVERLGFDPISIPGNEEGIRGCIKDLQKVEEIFLGVHERWNKIFTPVLMGSGSKSGYLKTLLEAEMDGILKYRRSAESMFPTSRKMKVSDVRRALNALAFFRSSVKYIGDNEAVSKRSEQTPEANVSAILEAIRDRESGEDGRQRSVTHYNELLSECVEKSLEAVVNVHYFYLREAGYFEQFARDRRDGLERFFEKKKRADVTKMDRQEIKSSGDMPRDLQVGVQHARECCTLLAEAVADLARSVR